MLRVIPIASGNSHAEGTQTKATNTGSHAEVIQLKLMVLLVTLVVLIVKLMVKHRLFMVLIHKQLVPQ
jgi:hypothetical protein